MKKMYVWLGIAGLSFLVLCANVTPAFAVGSKEGASAFVTNLGKQALGAITSTTISAEEKRATLRSLFEKNVDIDWISKFVLGQYWRTATPEQRTQYQQSYKDFLIKNYTTNFETFKNTSFQVTQAQDGDGPGEYILTMTLKRPGYDDIHVNYRVRDHEGGYRAYDFTVEGVSLIASQRSEFSSVVGRNGLDYLITQIKAKAAAAGSTAQN